MSEGCREGFLETNKKINYIARQETARQKSIKHKHMWVTVALKANHGD